MRIIAGAWKRRRLAKPTWPGLRPTSDRLRETMFNIVRDDVAEARVLDAYAGTGACGLEAMSRGAAAVTFIEHDPRAVSLIESNLDRCGGGRARVVRGTLPAVLADLEPAARFDLVLLDPPYEFETDAIDAILSAVAPRLSNRGRVVLERSRRSPTVDVAGLTHTRRVPSGDSVLECYVRTES